MLYVNFLNNIKNDICFDLTKPKFVKIEKSRIFVFQNLICGHNTDYLITL